MCKNDNIDYVLHYGKNLKNGYGLVKLGQYSSEIEVIIPTKKKDITDIYHAIAAILLTGKNLMRVINYECETHHKEHPFTFHSEISFSFPRMYGFDKTEDVIEFAKSLFKE